MNNNYMKVELNPPIDVTGAIVLDRTQFKELAVAFAKAMPKIEEGNIGLGTRHRDRLKKSEIVSLRELLDAIESGNQAIIDNYGK